MSDIATVPAPKAVMQTGGKIAALIPQSIDEAYRMATAFVAAGAVPEGTTQEKAFISIITGMEVGLPPSAAIQSIAVINGKATIYGDGALALVYRDVPGVKIKEWQEGKPDNPLLDTPRWKEIDVAILDKWTAYCRVERPGHEPVETHFSIGDYRRADKMGDTKIPLHKFPQRMIQMRARAWALRDSCADVLKGVAIREEVEDYEARLPEPKRITDITSAIAGGKKVVAEVVNEAGEAVPDEADPIAAEREGQEQAMSAALRGEPTARTSLEQSIVDEVKDAVAKATARAEVTVIVEEFEAAMKSCSPETVAEIAGIVDAHLTEIAKPVPERIRKAREKKA